MLLDDSSGALIEVTCARPTPTSKGPPPDGSNLNGTILVKPTTGVTATGRTIDLDGLDVGTVVKVKGGVKTFRGERQMQLERIAIVRSTNEEAAAWAENTAFHKDVLSTPWVVSERDEKRARRKAEGLDREKQAREERKRKKERAKLNMQEKKSVNAQEERRRVAGENERGRKDEAIRAAAEKQRERMEEAKRDGLEQETERNEGASRMNADMQERERYKKRREHERRLREQEYERLKGLKKDS